MNKAADSHPTGRKSEQILSSEILALSELLLNHDGLHTHGQNTPNEASSNPSIPTNPPMPEILVSRILSLHSKYFYKKITHNKTYRINRISILRGHESV